MRVTHGLDSPLPFVTHVGSTCVSKEAGISRKRGLPGTYWQLVSLQPSTSPIAINKMARMPQENLRNDALTKTTLPECSLKGIWAIGDQVDES
jgi:hypothetical protein